jgi:hypothetical protein
VIYVFGKKTFDLEHALLSILEVLGSLSNDEEQSNTTVLLKSDVMYSHLMGTSFLIIGIVDSSSFR